MAATIDAPQQWVENIAMLRLPKRADLRLQQLMDRNNERRLTEQKGRIWQRWRSSVNNFRGSRRSSGPSWSKSKQVMTTVVRTWTLENVEVVLCPLSE